MVRSALTSLTVTACLLSLAACDSEQSSSSAATPTSPASGSSDIQPSVPPYLSNYIEDERQAYEDAVAAYTAFSSRNSQLVRKGVAMADAKAYYEQATAAWQSYWARLRQFQSRDIRIVGRAEVLRVRPDDIELDDEGGGQVELRVCSIARGVRVLQSGSPMPQPEPKPTITEVSMVQLPDESSWRILSDKAGGSC